VRHWRRVPALNTTSAFIDDLADAVVAALPAAAAARPGAGALAAADGGRRGGRCAAA
jgi:hypothetical protein